MVFEGDNLGEGELSTNSWNCFADPSLCIRPELLREDLILFESLELTPRCLVQLRVSHQNFKSDDKFKKVVVDQSLTSNYPKMSKIKLVIFFLQFVIDQWWCLFIIPEEASRNTKGQIRTFAYKFSFSTEYQIAEA
jgi:hypothetical protein